MFILQVYISTSDVQMHFNYHRKDNAIQREGFLRFRGAEDCHTTHCLYRGINLTRLARTHYPIHFTLSSVHLSILVSCLSSSPLPVTRSHHRASNDNCKDHYYPSTARPLNNSLLTSASCNPLQLLLIAGQRTTHFHCNRSSCQFTFKNKADMGRSKPSLLFWSFTMASSPSFIPHVMGQTAFFGSRRACQQKRLKPLREFRTCLDWFLVVIKA